MGRMKTTWFHLSKFTKSGCHFDWMLGNNGWTKIKDALTGGTIKPLEPIFWNRTLGNISVSLESYMKARDDQVMSEKLRQLGLPKDIKL